MKPIIFTLYFKCFSVCFCVYQSRRWQRVFMCFVLLLFIMQQGTRSEVRWKLEYIMAEVSSPDEYQANLMHTAPAAICPELCLTHKPEHKHHLNASERANFINIFNKVYSNGKGYPCIAGNKSGFWMCSPRLPQITISLHQVNVSSKYLPAIFDSIPILIYIFLFGINEPHCFCGQELSVTVVDSVFPVSWRLQSRFKKKSTENAVTYTELLKHKRGLNNTLINRSPNLSAIKKHRFELTTFKLH